MRLGELSWLLNSILEYPYVKEDCIVKDISVSHLNFDGHIYDT